MRGKKIYTGDSKISFFQFNSVAMVSEKEMLIVHRLNYITAI